MTRFCANVVANAFSFDRVSFCASTQKHVPFEKQKSQHCVLPYRFLSHPGSMYYSPSRLVSCLVITAVLNAIRLSYDWRQGRHLQDGWRHHLYHNNQLMCNLSICVCVFFPFFVLFGDAHHQHDRSRKRRSSPSSANGAADVIMDEDEDSDVMDECAAAMVLMRLSCSPHSPRWEGEFFFFFFFFFSWNGRLVFSLSIHPSPFILRWN